MVSSNPKNSTTHALIFVHTKLSKQTHLEQEASSGQSPSGQTLSRQAFAKINLFLHLGKLQKNGRHRLSALNVFASLSDSLSYRLLSGIGTDRATLHVSGLCPSLVGEQKSSMHMAFKIFAHHHHLQKSLPQQPPRDHLHGHLRIVKRIPSRAGLGGGSSDAATMLSLLSQSYGDYQTPAMIAHCAKIIGSDLYTCMLPCANIVEGTGEDVHLLPPKTARRLLSKVGILIVTPRSPYQRLDTAKVFHTFDRMSRPVSKMKGFSARLPQNRQQFFRTLRCKCRNDLTHAASCHIPILSNTLQLLHTVLPQHLLLARMSGSGSSCYALFPSYGLAVVAKQQLMGIPLVKKQLSIFVGSLVQT